MLKSSHPKVAKTMKDGVQNSDKESLEFNGVEVGEGIPEQLAKDRF